MLRSNFSKKIFGFENLAQPAECPIFVLSKITPPYSTVALNQYKLANLCRWLPCLLTICSRNDQFEDSLYCVIRLLNLVSEWKMCDFVDNL